MIDLRERLGLPAPPEGAGCIVITRLEGRAVGMIVDAVTDVLRLPREAVEPPPPMIADVSGAYLRGIGRVGDRLVVLIDISRVLGMEEAEALTAQTAEVPEEG